ncbi:EamA family transporter [Phenylobacterium sp.]|uniref:EamA family transporter n=1 Tax=Phenylobacterium sp. TaxID=1871053 RepID=UPI00261F6CEB|nr:EamA family transporter [Phenylobacterium sp.]
MAEKLPPFSWAPYAAFLASALCFCASTVLAKVLIPELGVGAVSACRTGGAAAVLVLLWRPWRTVFSRRDLLTVAGYGLALAAMNVSFYAAIRTIPIGVAMAIQFAGPLAVGALSSRRALDFIWLSLAAAGLLLLIPEASVNARLDGVGVAWAAAAAAFWASYMVLGRATSHLPAGPTVALGMSAAAAILAPYGLVEVGRHAPSVWVAWVIPGVVAASALAYSLEMVALRGLPPRTIGVLINTEPALGAVAGLVVFGQFLAPLQWAAMGAIMSASIGSIVSARSVAGARRGEARTSSSAV